MWASSENVKRTARWAPQFLHDVGVDHRGLDVRVAQVLLDLPDVDPVEEKMRRETMAA
jgi:hypothetical protein